jgi:hypothetical protein
MMKKMTEKINLKNIERKNYVFYHQDGISDLLIGSGILFAVLCFLNEMIWLGGAFVILAVLLYPYTKQKITAPRIGFVKFGQKGQHKTLFILLILIGNIFLLFFLGLFLYRNNIPSEITKNLTIYPSLIIGGTACIVTLLTALISGIIRFYFYAALILTIFVIGQISSIDIWITSAIIGTIILFIGLIKLVNFIQKYPITDREIINEK